MSADQVYFPRIAELMENVKAHNAQGVFKNMEECLNDYIRVKRYWPMVQTKKFFGKKGLMLLHNTYKRTDVEHFQELYDEIRSVVLDMNAPDGHNVVVSLADKIPERIAVGQLPELGEGARCEMAYEGTMVYVYSHRDSWYFGTSTCPSVDGSKYFHPTKTHGMMLDEVLGKLYPEALAEGEEVGTREQSKRLREAFTTHLNPDNSYGFILIHHENRHIMDYTPLFGEKYMELLHIFTRDKQTKEAQELDLGLRVPETFATPTEALARLEADPMAYAVLVRTAGGTYKVSTQEILQRETENIGNANPWMNMLATYMQNNPEHTVHRYVEKYLADRREEFSITSSVTGRKMSPTFVINTTMKYMRDCIYNLYHSTTTYSTTARRYTMNLEADKQLPPILRFHLAQLRHIQITTHHFAPISIKAVYHYLCLHNTMKNIRLLIQFFSTNVDFHGAMDPVVGECFTVLYSALTGSS